MPATRPIITLTSDFGYRDHYVSALKAAIIGIAPEVRMIDVSHSIPPQDVMAGAWVLRNAAFVYPPGSIHVAVVDSKSGTSPGPLAIKIDDQIFVGPDNGLFSLIAVDKEYSAWRITKPDIIRKKFPVMHYGRDVIAPAAAWLASGNRISDIGEKVEDIVTYRWATPISDNEGIQGWVVHIDTFGNLISNIPSSMLEKSAGRALKIYVGTTILNGIVKNFSDVSAGDPAALIGNSDMLEIVVNRGCAEELLGVQKGAPVSVIFQK